MPDAIGRILREGHGMTPRRRDIMDAIADLIEEKGYSPTLREIGDAVGITSPSTMHVHLHALRSTGWITFDDGRTRTIRIVRR